MLGIWLTTLHQHVRGVWQHQKCHARKWDHENAHQYNGQIKPNECLWELTTCLFYVPYQQSEWDEQEAKIKKPKGGKVFIIHLPVEQWKFKQALTDLEKELICESSKLFSKGKGRNAQ
ncbi:MAG: hypothetical protein AAFV95_02820 [Bacteroidota bacterium]